MSNDANPEYEPTNRFQSVSNLFGNHYRFTLAALPDLTFFVQRFTMPTISSAMASRPNPFTSIREVGDHIDFSAFTVSYLIDNSFKTYFSLFYWLKGYGFPNTYQEILDFKTSRQKHLANPRPMDREIFKTQAVLTILQPDNDTAVAEITFEDVFPTVLSEVSFDTIGSEPTVLSASASFYYTDFNVRLTNT